MKKRLQLAMDLARQAGALLRQGYGDSVQVKLKGSIDLVTEYDLRSEQFIVDGIRGAFPKDAILAEEGSEIEAGEVCWLVDPLDGTTNFAHGLPIFSVSIAGLQDDETIFGVVYDPLRDELFRATAGGGAWLNDRPIRVSAAKRLEDSLLVTGFPYDIRTNPDNNLDHYNVLAVLSRGVRRLGSAAIDLAYVAAGRMDGYWELRLNPWDWAAGVLLTREAGGVVTDFAGNPHKPFKSNTLAASNGLIHGSLLEALQQETSAPIE